MRVIGIDPGLTRLGFGVVEETHGGLSAIAHGTIRAEGPTAADRLAEIGTEIAGLLDEHRPEAAAVERLFLNRNRRTATRVGQASGVVIAALAAHGLAVHEYGPMEVKSSLTGYGGASKEQVTYMVCALLRLNVRPDSADAADALAVAICHLHSRRLKEATR